MKRTITVALAAMLAASGANAATVFGIDSDRNLVSFNSSTPGTFTSTVAISGTNAGFLAMDFRDSNGVLYALGDDFRLYTVNTFTGFASAVGAPLAISGANFGFDFNTAIDALRIVSNNDNNYVVNPNTGVVSTTATPVAYAPGDINAGGNAVITGNGYIHGTATQYAIDVNADFLVTQANNAGTLASVGTAGLGFNAMQAASFDIDFDGVGYIMNGRDFYSVNLQTGVATQLGTTRRANGNITAMAIQAPVPEPATWAMLILGFGVVGGAMRRRAANAKAARTRLTYA